MNKILVVVLLVTTYFSSCKKEDVIPPSKTALLTEKHWIYAAWLTRDSPTQQWQDSYSLMDNCDKDDRWVFNTDGTFMVEEGPTRCFGGSLKASGTWKFINNETEIIFQLSSGAETLKIDQLDAATLKLSFMSNNFSEIVTFKH